jgi:hypothetical protein
MASARRKLGLMVSTAPDHPNLETALGLSKAALDGGGDVYLYLIERRRPLSDRATNCGLVVLTDVINGTDRFVSLN